MNHNKITVIGAASLVLQELKKPKSFAELKDFFSGRFPDGSGFLFERTMNLLINLGQVKTGNGKLIAYRSKVDPRDLVRVALG